MRSPQGATMAKRKRKQRSNASPAETSEEWVRVGRELRARGQLERARRSFAAAIEANAQNASAHAQLGALFVSCGNHQAALGPLLAAVEAAPNERVYQIQLGQTLTDAGHLEQAQRCLEQVRARWPGEPWARAALATVHQRKGHPEVARALVAPLVEEAQPLVNAVATYAHACRRLGQPGAAVLALRRALEAHAADGPSSILLGHILGDCLDTLGEHREAFAAYRRANDRRATGLSYDPAAHELEVDHLVDALARALPEAGGGQGEELVFIVGMPRSGTSLVEQILACHPEVLATGEREEMRLLVAAVSRETGPDWAAKLHQLRPAALESMRAHYLTQVVAGSKCARVTDKMPQNYLHLPLVAQLFPRARVVHCVRDASDTCLSGYFQNFGATQPFSTRLDWLGHRHGQYRRAMTAFSRAAPSMVHEVHYEALVSDPEPHIRALVEFVGLPWDEACVRPHESRRLVHTASYAQVTRPIYRGSVGRAEAYATELEELRGALVS